MGGTLGGPIHFIGDTELWDSSRTQVGEAKGVLTVWQGRARRQEGRALVRSRQGQDAPAGRRPQVLGPARQRL